METNLAQQAAEFASKNPSRSPTTDQVRRELRPPSQLPEDVEAAILLALVRPLDPGDTHQAGNAKREAELRELLATLTPIQAFDLGRRLDANRDSDRIAVAFRRMIVERRQRLRAFLADARRRAA